MDLRNNTVRMAYGTGDVAGQLEGCQGSFQKLEDFLGQLGTPFFSGQQPSVACFHVFEMIEQHQLMEKFVKGSGLFDKFPLLSALHSKLKEDPKLKGYFESPEYAFPQNNKMAKYGGDLNDGR